MKSKSQPDTQIEPALSAATAHDRSDFHQNLKYLRLPFIRKEGEPLAMEAARKSVTHLDYLTTLIEGEANQRRDHATVRRVRNARFPVLKTLDTFRWDWPEKINRLQVQEIFRLDFLREKKNIHLLGGVGTGKTHLAVALGYELCKTGSSVLFSTAIDIINTLSAAQSRGTLKNELKRYVAPEVLLLDEIGYLPIDKLGADLLFQVISARYERGSIILTSNKAFKEWVTIFNNDATVTSAILDRLLHHAETVIIEGKSFRMKDRIQTSE
jgi:DNA replication protein DnaC